MPVSFFYRYNYFPDFKNNESFLKLGQYITPKGRKKGMKERKKGREERLSIIPFTQI
jgi:hypothetical protein